MVGDLFNRREGQAPSGGLSRVWRACFAGLLFIQFTAIFLLVEEYPRTALAPIVAVGCLATMNVLLLGFVPSRWRGPLQLMVLLTSAACLMVALVPVLGMSIPARGISVASACLLTLALAWRQLPSRSYRWFFSGQQFALGATLLGWLATESIRAAGSFERLMTSQHFHAGMRAFFAAPILLGGIVAIASFSRTKSHAIAFGAICTGQYGIGFMELGWALDSDLVFGIGTVLGCSMLLLLIVAWTRARAEKLREVPDSTMP